jgi:DNA-binding transcriptional MerR regulator
LWALPPPHGRKTMNADDLLERLRSVQESQYGLGVSLTQIRRMAQQAADRIEKLEQRERAVKAAIDAIKEKNDGT